MSVALLLITHNELGSVLLETATKMLGRCPMVSESLAVTETSDTDLLQVQAQRMFEELDQGNGVLVLTDIFGSTPSNIACRLHTAGKLSVIAGVNLPMLVRVLNYPDLALEELTEKALTGGTAGVMSCHQPQ